MLLSISLCSNTVYAIPKLFPQRAVAWFTLGKKYDTISLVLLSTNFRLPLEDDDINEHLLTQHRKTNLPISIKRLLKPAGESSDYLDSGRTFDLINVLLASLVR